MSVTRAAAAALMLTLISCSGHMNALRDSSPPKASGSTQLLGDAYYHYLRAMDAENVGDLELALNHFREALVFDPDAHQIMTRISRVLERMGQRDEALTMAERALGLEPAYVPAMLQLARMYAFSGRFDEAKGIYHQALEIETEQAQIYLELARLYRREGALTEALEVLDAYSGQNTRTSVSHMSLEATVLREMNRPKDAQEVYLDLLSTYPWVEQPRRELIGLFLLEGGAEYAADRLEKLYELEPWQDWIPSALVDLYIQLENIPALMSQLDELEQRSPENRDLRLGAVQALVRNGAFEEAEDVVEPSLTWDGLDGDNARYLYAHIAFNQNNYEEAAIRFGAIEPGSDAYVDALIRRSFSLQQIGRLDEAVVEVESYLTEHPEANDVRFALGAIYEDADRHEDAIATFDTLLEAEPDHIDAIARRAISMHAMGDTEEAIKTLNGEIARLSGYTDLHEVLAGLYTEEQRFDDAIKTLQAALRVDADDFELRYQLASTMDRAGQKIEAIAQMKLLLERYPDNPDILNFIGYTYAELGIELPTAEIMIQKALEQDPDNGYMLDSLGWVYFKQAEYDRATPVLERAVQLSNQEAVIIEHLADAYAKTGQLAQALALYDYALTQLSEDPDAIPTDIERLSTKINDLTEQGVEPTLPAVLTPAE